MLRTLAFIVIEDSNVYDLCLIAVVGEELFCF